MSGARVPDFEHPQVVACPNGPLLVRGATSLEDEDGVIHHSDRPVAAICRCRRSARLPWCDGTHKLLAADARPDYRGRGR